MQAAMMQPTTEVVTVDLRHHFHRIAVPEAKLPSQAVGPRVPWAWFRNLDEKSDACPPEGVWLESDLHRSWDIAEGEPLEPFCQPCGAAIQMGEGNAVWVAQTSSCRGVARTGFMSTDADPSQEVDSYQEYTLMTSALLRSVMPMTSE